MSEHDFGFDPRTADMIVGTSAGSITGTLLRLGVKAEDLAAWTVKAPLSGDGIPPPRPRVPTPVSTRDGRQPSGRTLRHSRDCNLARPVLLPGPS